MYKRQVQEKLAKKDESGHKLDNTLFLFGVQMAMNALFAAVVRAFVGGSAKSKALDAPAATIPFVRGKVKGWMWLAFISASYTCAMLSSHQALKYVSYPLQALSKSSKIVPVMVGNVLVGAPISRREIVSLLAITAGIFVFQWKPSTDPRAQDSSWIGYGLLALSLALDGVTGSHQHLFDKEFKLSTHDLMLGMNASAFALMAVPLVLSGELTRGLAFVSAHPATARDVLLFGLASALGQNFIFYTITSAGPLATTTITTTRKFFTILVSVLMHPENSLDAQQWLGVVMVFSALAAEIYGKARDSTKAKPGHSHSHSHHHRGGAAAAASSPRHPETHDKTL